MISKTAVFDSEVVLMSNRIRSYFLAVLGNANSESDDISWYSQNLLSNCVRMQLALEESPEIVLGLVAANDAQKVSFAATIDMITYNWNRIITNGDEADLHDRFDEIAQIWATNKAHSILSRMSKYSDEHLKSMEYVNEVATTIDDTTDVDKVVIREVTKRLNSNPKNVPISEAYVETLFKKFITISGITNQDTIDEKCQEVYCSLLGYVKELNVNGLTLQRKIIFQSSTTEQFIRQLQRQFPAAK